jgi:hypothetical protein
MAQYSVVLTGLPRFAKEDLPWRTVIDVRGGVMFPGVTVDPEAGTVTIIAGGREALYTRRGYDIHGAWVCDLAYP